MKGRDLGNKNRQILLHIKNNRSFRMHMAKGLHFVLHHCNASNNVFGC